MKIKNLKYHVILVLILASFQLRAQNNINEIVVPLSKPGSKGNLKVNLLNGSIAVNTYSGKEVIINTKTVSDHDDDDDDENRDGLKKLNSNSFSLDVEEKNNTVKVSSHFSSQEISLEIKVPKNFSVDLRTVNDGDIEVTGVSGNHEVTNVNGDIRMFGISGSAIAANVNGEIKIVFDKVTPNTPMAFTTMNDDIDISFPADVSALLKMSSRMGDIYTGFDVELIKTKPEIDKSSESGVYRVKVKQDLQAKLGKGGPEFKFKNFNGDIIIRKKK